jgi:hypothetical protein
MPPCGTTPVSTLVFATGVMDGEGDGEDVLLLELFVVFLTVVFLIVAFFGAGGMGAGVGAGVGAGGGGGVTGTGCGVVGCGAGSAGGGGGGGVPLSSSPASATPVVPKTPKVSTSENVVAAFSIRLRMVLSPFIRFG